MKYEYYDKTTSYNKYMMDIETEQYT